MLVGFVKGYYIFRYECNSIFGMYTYEITDGIHVLAHYFSNDYNKALIMVETLLHSNDNINTLTA